MPASFLSDNGIVSSRRGLSSHCSASREDIETTLSWNRTLRNAVTEAFLLSIHHFNQGQLKYVWPCYLSSTSTLVPRFLNQQSRPSCRNFKISVLESCADTMTKPSSSKYVPLDPFADGEGKPSTLNPQAAASYLPFKYPIWDIEGIAAIGVSHLSPQEFLKDLSLAVIHDPTTFRTRSATWHSQLAETLVRFGTNAELLSMIQDICLIPLRDGTWTSAKEHAIFFSKNETSLEIPSGIGLFVVNSIAESDPNRRKLFTNLGVKSWETPEICRLILKVHASSDFDPKSLPRDQLISHAMFLYKTSWQPPKTADLWFATMQNQRCLGRKLYIPGSIPANTPAGRIFTLLPKNFAVIHNDYLEASPLDAYWPLWLVNNLGLSMVPSSIAPHRDAEPQPIQTFKVPENKHVGVPATVHRALPDYQMQLMLLEQQNERRRLIARQEQQEILATDNQALPGYQMQSMVVKQQNEMRRLMERQEQEVRATGNQALQDYHSQLMFLEQQNKKRLLMPRQEPELETDNHALRDYQMQLMMFEQQKKKRLLMARQEQEHQEMPPQDTQSPIAEE